MSGAGRRPRATGVVVLGGTGCVGAAISTAFAGTGLPVLTVSRSAPVTRLPGVTWQRLDVAAAAADEVAAVLEDAGPRVVVNATGGWLSTEQENERQHVTLVQNLVDALTRLPRPPHLVHVGSIHEYGPVPVGARITESTVARPQTSYARTKLAGAQIVLRAAGTGRISAVVLRAVNVCGPGSPASSFLGSACARLRSATRDEPAEITVSDARRDYVDVRDLADAVVRAADPVTAAGVVNIGRGEAVAMSDLLDMLVAAAQRPPGAVRVLPGPVDSRGADWTLSDNTLAADLLGWYPRVTLPTSIQDMWAEYRTEEPTDGRDIRDTGNGDDTGDARRRGHDGTAHRRVQPARHRRGLG